MIQSKFSVKYQSALEWSMKVSHLERKLWIISSFLSKSKPTGMRIIKCLFIRLNLFIDLVTYFNLAGFFGSLQFIHANEKWVMSSHPNCFSLNVHEIMLITVEHVECRKTIESLTLINLWSFLLRAFRWNQLRQVYVFHFREPPRWCGWETSLKLDKEKLHSFAPQSTRKLPTPFCVTSNFTLI